MILTGWIISFSNVCLQLVLKTLIIVGLDLVSLSVTNVAASKVNNNKKLVTDYQLSVHQAYIIWQLIATHYNLMLKLFGHERILGGILSASSAGMGGQFRSNLWDPVLIVAQIVTMQASFYLCLGLWVFFLDVIGRFDVSLDQIFTQSVSFCCLLFHDLPNSVLFLFRRYLIQVG